MLGDEPTVAHVLARSSPASNCGTSMPELEPRIFSFNSPHGACERCTGLGSQMEIDPELRRARPVAVDRRGRAGAVGDQLVELLRADHRRRSPRSTASTSRRRGRSSPRADRDLFLYGTNGERVHITYRNRYGRRRSYATRFEGIIPNLERRYRETDSECSREKIEEYMSLRRARLQGLAAAARSRGRCSSAAWRSTSSARSRCAARCAGSTRSS